MNSIKDHMSQLIIFVVIAVAIVGLVLIVGGSDDDSANSDAESQSSQSTSLPTETSQPADGVAAPENVETASLSAVGSYSGDGEATRSYDEQNKFMHEVVANLDDPAAGKFYEGWITGDGQIVSTGKLESEGDGMWSLVYTSQRNQTNLNNVVITEETEADGLDGKPEAHVLEGSF